MEFMSMEYNIWQDGSCEEDTNMVDTHLYWRADNLILRWDGAIPFFKKCIAPQKGTDQCPTPIRAWKGKSILTLFWTHGSQQLNSWAESIIKEKFWSGNQIHDW